MKGFSKYFVLMFMAICSISTVTIARAVTLSFQLPGTQAASLNNPCTTVINFYYFALFISGILAFGAIVWGGIKYSISAGNPSGQSEGLDWIKGAILGIILLAGSYFLLNIINPALVKCQMPTLAALPSSTAPVSPMPTPGATSTAPTPGATSTPPSTGGLACYSGSCVSIAGVVQTCKNGCQADQNMLNTLSCINLAGFNLRITEAMPTSSAHSDPRHNDGCAVDATLGSPGAPQGGCSNLNNLENAISSCGGGYLNEYFNSCGGVNTEHSTGEHIHITAASCN